MALILNDRVKESTTSTGTGTINLDGATGGFKSFVAGIGTTNRTYYAIVGRTTTEFEVGVGVVTDASPDTLSRERVISSSNSNNFFITINQLQINRFIKIKKQGRPKACNKKSAI